MLSPVSRVIVWPFAFWRMSQRKAAQPSASVLKSANPSLVPIWNGELRRLPGLLFLNATLPSARVADPGACQPSCSAIARVSRSSLSIGFCNITESSSEVVAPDSAEDSIKSPINAAYFPDNNADNNDDGDNILCLVLHVSCHGMKKKFSRRSD